MTFLTVTETKARCFCC